MSNAYSDLTTASSSYFDSKTALGTIEAGVAPWTGLGADAWRASIGTLVTDLEAARDRILDGRAAIGTYRSTTLSISNRAATARSELEAALDVYTVQQPNQFSDPEGFEQWQNNRYLAGYRAQNARDEISRLALERGAADDDAIRGLAAALPANWADTVSALASVGISGVGDLTRSANKDALLELSQRIAAGGADPGDYEALALMLGMYENNETVMSELFLALGGEDTVNLIEATGDWGAGDPSMAAAALALAVLTRSGLSTGSQNWSQSQGDDFAESMFEVGHDKGDSIAYLFSDVVDSPLGLTLALAAANEIDEFERINGYQWMMDQTGGGLWLAMQEFGNDGNRMSDASGPIFSTLGQYPDAAYEWLTDGGTGDDRVDYWYHDRYDNMFWVDQNRGDIPWYIDHDGFQGVADLWFGSQQAAGGSINPGDVANPEEAADLAARIMLGLVTAEQFTPENISDAASASLAAGFVVNIAGFSQHPIADGLDRELIGGAYEMGPGYWVPALDDSQLAVFLARAGSHESGASVLSFGISSYQETLLNMAIESGNSQDIETALERIVGLQAALDGATGGQLIENAQATDAEREAIVSGVTTVLGAMPIPFIDKVADGVSGWVLEWGQNVALGIATDIGSDAIADIWASTTDDVRAEFEEFREGELKARIEATIAQSVYQYFFDVDPSVLAGIDPPSGDLAVWATENSEALEQILGDRVNAGEPESGFDYIKIGTLATDYDRAVGDWSGKVDDYAGYVGYGD